MNIGIEWSWHKILALSIMIGAFIWYLQMRFGLFKDKK